MQQPSMIRGRGATQNAEGRFAINRIELDADGQPLRHPQTEIRSEQAKRLINRITSPDVPSNLSINPYRGCEHGCVYCFARPSHSYLDLSPGLDFETKLTAKTNAVECFARELSKPGYRCESISLGINTDAYQPMERQLGLTRQLLEVALAFNQPMSIITKSTLILRDADLLEAMARRRLIHIAVSITTLDSELKRILEPRTAAGDARLRVVRELSGRDIPVSVMVAPVIPLINDKEMEHILMAAAEVGAKDASYILLRLPHELQQIFVDWLYQHFPQRAGHVIKRIEDMRGGRLYQNEFGERMRGSGIFAELLTQRFNLAYRKAGFDPAGIPPLDCSQFKVPSQPGDQLSLL